MENSSTENSKLGLIEQSFVTRYSLWVREALDELSGNFTITDPYISGHPIVFASRGFLKMTGYVRDEVIGKNGRVFQGPKTDRRSVMEIREAIREERQIQINLLNYRKNGSPFWILFHLCPVVAKEDGRVAHFVAVEVPIVGERRRNGSGLEDDWSGQREMVFGSCRREVSSAPMDSDRCLPLDWDSKELGIEERCEATEYEKQSAVSAINIILSVLTHYSELTNRLVCKKRCCFPDAGFLGSSLVISLGRIKQSFILIDPCLPDMPIVYASDAFLELTGYGRHEILGRNCRFLNGVDTDSSSLYQIQESVVQERACTVRVLYYRKDNSAFWNALHTSPVRNASGKIAYFVGVQSEDGARSVGRPDMRQLGVVGAVKVAVRSSSMNRANPIL